MIGIIIALISGALMAVQGVFNTGLTKDAGMWVSNTWVQFSAFLVCIIAWMFSDRRSFGELLRMEPKYMLLGGVIGCFITLTVIKSVAALGPAEAVMIIVISQLAVAYLIEVFGIFEVEKVAFQWRRLLGMGICIGGIVLFKWE